jgi:IS30 family transposase
MSFQISILPSRQAAARFVDSVRHTLLRAVMESKISQSEIARALGIHRSVINRELKGYQDITVGRAAQIAWAIGKEAIFKLEDQANERSNMPIVRLAIMETSNKSATKLPEKRQEQKAA